MNLPHAVYKWGWAIWAIYFIVLESLALIDEGRGDTLSENIRWLRDQYPIVLYWLIGGTITWLFIHFLFEDNL